jgi:putative NADH-flavin reductase
MKLTIFGATGGTGASLVGQALAAGHEVTAVVRDPARLTIPARLTTPGVLTTPGALTIPAGLTTPGPLTVPAREQLLVVTADVMQPAAISAAVASADAVLSALGPRGTGRTAVLRDSARSIIEAMHEAGTRRLVTVSGSIVTDEGEGPFMRHVVKPAARRTFLRHVCADMRGAEDEVRASQLDWTIIRPPRLTGGPAAGTYRTAIDRNLPRGLTISRADLAACMLALLGDAATIGRHIAIAS